MIPESMNSLGAMVLGRQTARTGPLVMIDVCAAAASAAARNSPAAPDLLAQCAAKGGGTRSTNGVNPDEHAIPRPVLIGAGVVGVLALGFLAYKLTR